LSGLENRALQDGPFCWDYTTQISVFDWGGRVGSKLDFIDSPRRHEGHEVFTQPLLKVCWFFKDKTTDYSQCRAVFVCRQEIENGMEKIGESDRLHFYFCSHQLVFIRVHTHFEKLKMPKFWSINNFFGNDFGCLMNTQA